MFYINTTLDFLPQQIPSEFEQENWIYVPEIAIHNVVPKLYMVSTYGRCYNCKTGIYYPNGNFKSKRYVYTRFKMNDGTNKLLGLHVVLMRSFNYINGCDNLQVNHLDGIKYHNWIWNLEWCTVSRNIQHAYDIGLHAKGEDNSTSKATNSQIELICNLIAKGYRTKDIISELQSIMPELNIKIIVDAIKEGKYWNHISCKYDLSNAYHNQFILTDQQVHAICRSFEIFSTNLQYKEVLDKIGFDYSNLSTKELNRIKETSSLIRNKRTRKDICQKYNY